jgi:hypothetical protein
MGNPPVFQGDVSALVSNDVWFGGPAAVQMYGVGTAVPVYAPNPYEPGSSTSHWDINAIQTPAVMLHAVILGTSQRQYAPVDLGALHDLGFSGIGDPAQAGVAGCAPSSHAEDGAGGSGAGGVLMGLLLLALFTSTWAMQTQVAPESSGK